MNNLSHIESMLDIDPSNYSFTLNENGAVTEIEFFDGEYNEFESFREDIFEALSGYTELELISIDTQNYAVKDLSKLSVLKKLKTLTLECPCSFTDLSPLKELEMLESIFISSGRGIMNLDSLTHLKHLRSITIHESSITDLLPLSAMNLRSLAISKAQISDLLPIKNQVNLTYLDLSGNRLQDVSLLCEFTALNGLDISHNDISDISALANLNQLGYLNISDNRIYDASFLAGKLKLRNFSCDHNNIGDVGFLAGMNIIERLDISYNPIKNYHPVKLLKGLHTLISNGIKAENISDIPFESNVQWLHLEDCGLSDVQFLRTLTNLRTVYLCKNSISNVSVFSTHYYLTEIDLSDNNIQVPYPIFFLDYLGKLDLRGNPFGNKQYLPYPVNSSVKDAGEYATIADLQKEMGTYFYEQKQDDEALAYFFHDQKTIEALEIYVRIFCSIPKEETFRLKFYFYRISEIQHLHRFENRTNLRVIMNKVEAKVETLLQAERVPFLHFLQSSSVRFPGNFISQHLKHLIPFQYYESLDGEIYYQFIQYRVNRTHLKEAFFYYKVLIKQQSAFQYRMANAILKCLPTEERAEHDKYMKLLINPDEIDVKMSAVKWPKEERVETPYVDDSDADVYSYLGISILKVLWIVALVAIPVMIICLPSNKLQGLGIFGALMLFLGKKLFSE